VSLSSPAAPPGPQATVAAVHRLFTIARRAEPMDWRPDGEGIECRPGRAGRRRRPERMQYRRMRRTGGGAGAASSRRMGRSGVIPEGAGVRLGLKPGVPAGAIVPGG